MTFDPTEPLHVTVTQEDIDNGVYGECEPSSASWGSGVRRVSSYASSVELPSTTPSSRTTTAPTSRVGSPHSPPTSPSASSLPFPNALPRSSTRSPWPLCGGCAMAAGPRRTRGSSAVWTTGLQRTRPRQARRGWIPCGPSAQPSSRHPNRTTRSEGVRSPLRNHPQGSP